MSGSPDCVTTLQPEVHFGEDTSDNDAEETKGTACPRVSIFKSLRVTLKIQRKRWDSVNSATESLVYIPTENDFLRWGHFPVPTRRVG